MTFKPDALAQIPVRFALMILLRQPLEFVA